MARPRSQEITLSPAKTQASDIGPPEVRPLSAISRLPIANRMARTNPTQERGSQSINEDHRLSPKADSAGRRVQATCLSPWRGICFIENSGGLRRHALRTLLAFVLPSRVLLIS